MDPRRMAVALLLSGRFGVVHRLQAVGDERRTLIRRRQTMRT